MFESERCLGHTELAGGQPNLSSLCRRCSQPSSALLYLEAGGEVCLVVPGLEDGEVGHPVDQGSTLLYLLLARHIGHLLGGAVSLSVPKPT